MRVIGFHRKITLDEVVVTTETQLRAEVSFAAFPSLGTGRGTPPPAFLFLPFDCQRARRHEGLQPETSPLPARQQPTLWREPETLVPVAIGCKDRQATNRAVRPVAVGGCVYRGAPDGCQRVFCRRVTGRIPPPPLQGRRVSSRFRAPPRGSGAPGTTWIPVPGGLELPTGDRKCPPAACLTRSRATTGSRR